MTNFLANTYFPADLLSYISASSVGTRYATAPNRTKTDQAGTTVAPTKSLFLAANDAGLDRLTELLSNPTKSSIPKRVQEDLQVIESVSLPDVNDRIRPDVEMRLSPTEADLPVMEAVLHPSGGIDGARPTPADTDVLRKWRSLVESLGGAVEIDWIRTVGSLTFVPVRLPVASLHSAAQFNALRSLQPMPGLREFGHPQRESVNVLREPQSNIFRDTDRLLRVAIFDGGCEDSSPYFSGYVREIVVGNIAEHEGARRHGTLVTSALLYGRDVTDPLLPARVSIDHFQVLPAHDQYGLEMYWLLDVIRDVVSTGDYHVVNLSLGPQRVIDDDDIDRWTSELDELAITHNVLFVVAAGNNGLSPAEELRRVEIPGDMVNGLTVGSCDGSRPARRASYSSIGPGRAGARIQPSGVAFGGTETDRFTGVDTDGSIIAQAGTSFSAPLVIHGFADLAERTTVDLVGPAVLRSFALHFARPCHRDEKAIHVGHGEFPSSYARPLSCDENEVHLLYRGTIGRAEYIPLVIPLPDRTDGRVSLRWTLATTVATDPADAVEYAKAGLDVIFRPHSQKRTFSKKGERNVVLHVIEQAVEAAQLIADGYTPSQEPSSETVKALHRGEAVLREEGKWETARLSDKRFNAGRLFRPRLDLAHMAREGGALAYNTPDLEYALLVTLRAGSTVALYDEVRTAFPVLVPLTAGIDISVTTE